MPNPLSNNDRINHGGMFYTLQELFFVVLTVMVTIALGLTVIWVTAAFDF
jgi:hypothetical protein